MCWLVRRMNSDSVGRAIVSLPTPHVRDRDRDRSHQPLTFLGSSSSGQKGSQQHLCCFLLLSVLHDTTTTSSSFLFSLPRLPPSPLFSLSSPLSPPPPPLLLLPPPSSSAVNPRTCIRPSVLPSAGWLSIVARFVVPSLLLPGVNSIIPTY